MRTSSAIKAALLTAIVITALGLSSRYRLVRLAANEVAGMRGSVPAGAFRLLRSLRGLPRHGDVVLYTHPLRRSQRQLARVIGLPGDRIAVRRGEVVRNGVTLEESYASGRRREERLPEITVPAWHVWLLVDERGAAHVWERDSRGLGPVPLGWVQGRVAEEAVR